MIKRLLIPFLLALPAAAAAQDLPAQAEAYLAEAITAAAAQAQLDQRQATPALTRLTGDDPRWMNPKIKPGQGPVITHMALFGATGAAAGPVQFAADAARVPVMLSLSAPLETDWPAEVDFIRTGGTWKLRALRLAKRRPTPVAADPETVLRDWLAGLQDAAARHNSLDRKSWLREALGQYWAVGGGGYWRRAGECPEGQKTACIGALAGAAPLWAAAILDREKTIAVERFNAQAEPPAGVIRVDIPRRTMVETRRYRVELDRDRRHGWQIASLAPAETRAEPAAAAITADRSDGEALVRSLTAALLGDGAPEMAALLANSEALDPYFAETREGRKAMGRLIAMKPMFEALGTRLDSPVITALGDNRYQLSFDGQKPPAPKPVFVVVQGEGGARIAGIEN